MEIHITADEEARTLVISDHGVGMNREELEKNLGTIAHSGTRAFLQAVKENGGSSKDLIGQFGVGFYSAFMVADQVEVHSRGWREDDEGLVWSSDGGSGYRIEESPEQSRGVRIVLHLLQALRRTGGKRGITTICIGGGLGGAMLVEAL